jgi:S1-C subfamily serine protease
MRAGNEQAYLGNMAIMVGGDLIVGIDGKEVVDTSDIATVMEKHQPGDQVTITFYRGRRKMVVKLTLGDAREVNT